jgi:hypothetical protein
MNLILADCQTLSMNAPVISIESNGECRRAGVGSHGGRISCGCPYQGNRQKWNPMVAVTVRGET